MSGMNRREFLQVLAVAAASGFALGDRQALAANPSGMYDLPQFGNVHLFHFTDCHAQLMPASFREPSINIGVGVGAGRPPHLVGHALLKHYGFKPNSAQAYAFTHLNFEQAAATFGKIGGFAHLATLVNMLRAERPNALLLDGGDTWQGSATSLWTAGQDMIDVCKLLGVEVMTGHWDFTYGADRVMNAINNDLQGKIEFLAQNVRTVDFEEPVFKPYTMRQINGATVAILGQAFPYTPISNPRHFVADWTFGIQEESMQRHVDEARSKGAQAVVLLSHNGMDVDLKLASRVTGIDVILGGHTHDGVPTPIIVKNSKGQTVVTNAGSSGKFLAVLDLDVSNGRVADFRYKLLPVFSNLLEPDPEMAALIAAHRKPYLVQLEEKLAFTEGLLYRRGNFNGSWDQLILDALIDVKGAEIAFSPGFRWGGTILPNQPITMEQLMDQTAITYPYTYLSEMSGATIKATLEDVCDNLFNTDPYLQQGGDMVRVGGMTYACDPKETIGKRISQMRLHGKPIQANKLYKVAGWAPVTQGSAGEPIWDVVAQWLRNKKIVTPRKLNSPQLIGMANNKGVA